MKWGMYNFSLILTKPFFFVILGSVLVIAVSKSVNGEVHAEKQREGELPRSKLEEMEGQDEFYQDDPFKSYLHWPRLHFIGQFQADTATVNNDVRNYNLSNFTTWNLFPMPDGNGQWNPNGTGTFRLISGQVASVCYVNGFCFATHGQDPIIGSSIREGGTSTSAKMVDLDPQSMDSSVIYGWKISIGHFFTADFRPAPLEHLWQKMRSEPSVDGDKTMGASYQSSLTNVKWLDGAGSSSFIRQLQRSMNACHSKELSIRFHLDMFNTETSSKQFLWGRIAGTIGVLGVRTPLLTSPSRNLEAACEIVRDASFVLDQPNRKIHIDLGNSLPITMNGSHSVRLLGTLAVGFAPNNEGCSGYSDWLGILPYRTPDWYKLTTGIQSFPLLGPMTFDQMRKAAESPLVVAEVQGTWPNIFCKRVLLREAADGLLIRPQGHWIFRRDAMEPVDFDLFVTRFGQALANASVIIGRASQFLQNFTKALDKGNCFSEPKLDVPPLRLPKVPIITNGSGIASVSVQTRDPGNPRKIIDGQVYRISYNLPFHHPKKEYVIRILVWDSYYYHSPPNWRDNVFPIFKLYANLFPVMKHTFIDLGNFHQVVESRRLIKMAMSLPMEHPNHMPVSRDLSKAKRKMILEWLSQDCPLFHGRDFNNDQSDATKHQPKHLRKIQEQSRESSTILSISGSPNTIQNVHLDDHKRHSSRPFGNIRKEMFSSHVKSNSWIPPAQVKTPTGNQRQTYRSQYRPLVSNRWKELVLPMNQRKSSKYTHSLSKPFPKAIVKHREQLRRTKDYAFQTNKYSIQPNRESDELENYISLEQLRANLQTALELEHATIPPYLTALVSIKQEHNKDVKLVLDTILVQEMLHVALVANLLNAVGGKPSLTHNGFVLDYPSVLPGGVHRHLVIPLQKLSKKLIKDVFMKIEEPTLIATALEERRLIIEDSEKSLGYQFQQTYKSGLSGEKQKRSPSRTKHSSGKEENEFSCLSYDSFSDFRANNSFDREAVFTRHKNTIGSFYNHILKTIGYLTKCGKDNSIFVGDSDRQLSADHWYARDSYGHGSVIKVTDYFSAVAAIKEIVEEGEGSSPCMPAAASLEVADLSHYFAFYSLYTGRIVNLREWMGKDGPIGMSYNEFMWWKVCKSIYTFDGSEVSFDPEGVWPLLSNARMSNYVPWSRTYMLSYTFNEEYAKLMASLEHVFNGHPDDIRDAMGLMYSVYLHAKKLVRMPIDPQGNPDDGPNAGPTFEILKH